ncbi:MAG: hypothetical protein NC820_06425 [Candidatus Omnitrophica bacterium]|nr:hypothetical protein [Candidatus Omnitrophota bacterium]
MVKINKTICIDEDLFLYLRKENINASELINNLLRDSVGVKRLIDMSKEELQVELRKEELKREYEDKLKELNNNGT